MARTNPGKVQLLFRCIHPGRWEVLLELPLKVDLNQHVISFFEQTFGARNILFQRKKPKLAKIGA